MKQPRISLSQETITILTVGVALAGLYLATYVDFRGEVRADVEALRAEGRADRKEMRAEGRASREAFEKQITRLVEKQGTLYGLMDGLRNPIASLEE